MTREWELANPDCHLQALSTSVSDHCPMLLSCNPFHRKYSGFRFEACWLHLPGLRDMVAQSWNAPVHAANKARLLHIKLSRLSKVLRRWNKQRMHELKRDSEEAQQTVLRLNQLQEQRTLADHEIREKNLAKGKILGLAAVKKIKLRQRSRLTWIKEGDANSKLFHLKGQTHGEGKNSSHPSTIRTESTPPRRTKLARSRTTSLLT
jgi:hypothetical protein